MSVRANWHLDVEVDDSDPFAEELVDVRTRGTRIDLTDPVALQGRLAELVEHEGELYRQGVTCRLKDLPDTCCSACPLRGSLTLCELGAEQERMVMQIRVADA